jgi:hypothetical protein
MLVVSWLLEREYRLHRLLDINLPETFSRWRATVDARVQRKGCETPERIVKVVIHPGETETWARHEGRPVNEQARSDYADLLWRIEADFRARGRNKAAIGPTREPRLRSDLTSTVTRGSHMAEAGRTYVEPNSPLS